MTRQLSDPIAGEPIYSKVWNWLKRFPQVLHEGSQNPPPVSGPAAAALISTGIGAVTMMVTHHLADTSKEREGIVRIIGSWIPGSVSPDPMWGNIGSYAGKETMFLIGWLVSWAILYSVWKNKAVKSRTMIFWMFALFTLASAMSWHPLFAYLPLL